VSPEVRATYRVQLNKNFTLTDAAAIVDYLADLGISHLYCSPYLQSRPGSTHGYDVVDHRRVDPELGGEAALEGLIEKLNARSMGHILDVVPNHMTIAERANEWWWDVLKRGPYSDYAAFFDIDWDPAEDRLRRSILMPILGDHYGRVLEKNEIQLAEEDGETVVRYYDHVLPVAPDSIEKILGPQTEISTALDRFNEDTEALHALLELQHYRLAYWRTAGQELNYRRFFAINDLAALRIDHEEVFDRVHELVLRMVEQGRLQGLRIDHIDGLRYPTRYLTRLRSMAPDAYIVVEKILEPTEELPEQWPVEGTTGYDFCNRVTELFVDPAGMEPFTELYSRFTGESTDLGAERRRTKMLMIDTEFGGEIERLTELFVGVCERERRYRDYTRSELREALRETAASFPVYRTYVDPDYPLGPQDIAYVQEAISDARRHRPDLDGELFELLSEILLLRIDGPEAEALAVRFQQTSGPVVAKGVEDTLFYRFNRLVSLNEVGGDPSRFGMSLDEFHEYNRSAQERWPQAMLATSTHDTKRSDDVRARIGLLSEIPEAWAAAVDRWSQMNAKHKRSELPEPNVEYLLYQTLVGAWPLGVRRATVYMQKAIREAKVHTSWIDRNPTYESAVHGFTERVLGDPDFEADLEGFVQPLVLPGRITSLSATLIKLTAPGVPDFYQGSELWDLSLVDPDNRRRVDYDHRRELFELVKQTDTARVLTGWEAGVPKMYVTHQALKVKIERPSAFGATSSYTPLNAGGTHADRVVAYLRGQDCVTVCPRFVMGLGAPSPLHWDNTSLALPPGNWVDRMTGAEHTGTVHLTDLLSRFPVALLVRT
jgi:(1->4)-alpha-D-glucan 1-alpha-D-glucosylmutase